jgi:hypothetical protein
MPRSLLWVSTDDGRQPGCDVEQPRQAAVRGSTRWPLRSAEPSATTTDLCSVSGGVIAGRGLGKSCVSDAQRQVGWSRLGFDVPGVSRGVVVLAGYLVALVITYVGALRAARVYPAAAFRY